MGKPNPETLTCGENSGSLKDPKRIPKYQAKRGKNQAVDKIWDARNVSLIAAI